MKKLIIAGAFLIVTAFAAKAKNTITDTSSTARAKISNKLLTKPTGTTIDAALNGVLMKDALSMESDFETNYYEKQKLTQLNIWFNINVVKEIVKVLKDDSINQVSASHKVDGIRIYFSNNKATSTINILLVTTVDSSFNGLHHDYYTHDSSEPLFTDVDRVGKVYTKGEDKGANLYKWRLFGFADDITCNFKDHPHYIKRHTGRKMVNAFGSDVVNTKAEWLPMSVFEDVVSDPNCDGMRIYFGKHPAKDRVDTIYNNRDAFVLVTTKSSNNYHKDYFNCSTFQESVDKHTRQPFAEHILISGTDNGELCPDNCE
jgi:hypothetical protein